MNSRLLQIVRNRAVHAVLALPAHKAAVGRTMLCVGADLAGADGAGMGQLSADDLEAVESVLQETLVAHRNGSGGQARRTWRSSLSSKSPSRGTGRRPTEC